MKYRIATALLGLLCLAAAPTATIVNGGLIVFHGVQAHWTQAPGAPATFVVVAADAEFRRLSDRLLADHYADTARLAEGGPDMKLGALDAQRLSGRLVVSGRRVLVVSHSYAVRHPALR